MNKLFPLSAFAALAIAAFGFAPQAQAAHAARFLCNAPAGHVCKFQIQTAAGPINFALPSGKHKTVAAVKPGVDKYCVCDPGPVTADCKAPQLDHWCLGQWVDVVPGLNSLLEIPGPKLARRDSDVVLR